MKVICDYCYVNDEGIFWCERLDKECALRYEDKCCGDDL